MKRHGYRHTRVYRTWSDMKRRCTSPTCAAYKTYKGRLCDEWYDPVTFITWALSNGYSDELTIDRIDNSKGYSPDNCRFISREDNIAKGTKDTKRLYLHEGNTYTMTELAKHLGLPRPTVQSQIVRSGKYKLIK